MHAKQNSKTSTITIDADRILEQCSRRVEPETEEIYVRVPTERAYTAFCEALNIPDWQLADLLIAEFLKQARGIVPEADEILAARREV